MVRNLLNKNSFEFFPTLRCLYKIGQELSTLMPSAMSSMIGLNMIINKVETIRSKSLLTTLRRPSNGEGLYSSATIGPILAGEEIKSSS